jgi:hypothetical protein
MHLSTELRRVIFQKLNLHIHSRKNLESHINVILAVQFSDAFICLISHSTDSTYAKCVGYI